MFLSYDYLQVTPDDTASRVNAIMGTNCVEEDLPVSVKTSESSYEKGNVTSKEKVSKETREKYRIIYKCFFFPVFLNL